MNDTLQEPLPWWAWLFPILLGVFGGLGAWLHFRKKKKGAGRLLVCGIIVSIIAGIMNSWIYSPPAPYVPQSTLINQTDSCTPDSSTVKEGETPTVETLSLVTRNGESLSKVPPEKTYALKVTATFDDRTQKDVTSDVIWRFSKKGVATILPTGRLRTKEAGVTDVVAHFEGFTASLPVEVCELQIFLNENFTRALPNSLPFNPSTEEVTLYLDNLTSVEATLKVSVSDNYDWSPKREISSIVIPPNGRQELVFPLPKFSAYLGRTLYFYFDVNYA